MYFGTDGIRSQDVEALRKMGYQMGFAQRGKGTVVVAEDNRPSSERIVKAVLAGLRDAECEILYGGVMPIAALQYAVNHFTADAGIMVTASHNPARYNGLKFFNAEGVKPDAAEIEALERAMAEVTYAGQEYTLAPTDTMVKAYVDKFARFGPLPLRIAVDCANGAAYPTVKRIVSRLSPDAIYLHHGEGKWINRACGATQPDILRELHDVDLSFALDGDGDRCILVTRGHRVVDGDGMLYLLARYYRAQGRDLGVGVVSTVMANGALAKALNSLGLRLFRCDVGDKNVAMTMREKGCVLGGEPSGHILIEEGASDGILTGLTMAAIATQMDIDEALADYEPWPQYHTEVALSPHALRLAKAAEDKWRDYLAGTGRVVVRPSGTEPVVRIMVECESMHLAENIAESIVQATKRAQ